METIVISGKEFQYEIYHDGGWNSYETRFYLGTKIKTYRKYLFFGPRINIEIPKLVFIFYGNVLSNVYTKEELKAILEKKAKLIDRQTEIDLGELI